MKDKLQDCYFYFETDRPSENDTLKIMCVSCHDSLKSTKGWFWQGSIKGYGPYDFICDTCGKAVYKHKKETKNHD